MGGSFKKNENGNYTRENLHRKNQERKECYRRNNSQNRCMFGITRAAGLLTYADNNKLANHIEKTQVPATNITETILVEYLDSKTENPKNEISSPQEESNKTSDFNDKGTD